MTPTLIIDDTDADTPLAFSDAAIICWVRTDDGSFAFLLVDPEPPDEET